jgi:S1-C subfamily serine protease
VGSLLAVALIAAVAASGLTIGGVALWGDAEPAASSDAAVASTADDAASSAAGDDAGGASAEMSTTEIANELAPSVAAVDVAAGPVGSSQAQASAVVIDSDGYLVTNNHVVEGADGQLSVTLADGTSHQAQVVGTDPASDLAVLRVDADGLPAAELADQTPPVGTPVVAIGSPFGLEGSVTSGIVSAHDRSLASQSSVLVGLIQTDAAINPGNSGGPLVNHEGKVVGINSAIVSQTGQSSGVGFAVPAPVVSDVSQQLIDTGEVERAQIGIRVQSIEPRVAEMFDLEVGQGVLVSGVDPDSDAAGTLQSGDVIVGLEGESVADAAELVQRLMQLEPGDTVALTVVRDGQETTVEVQLQAA